MTSSNIKADNRLCFESRIFRVWVNREYWYSSIIQSGRQWDFCLQTRFPSWAVLDSLNSRRTVTWIDRVIGTTFFSILNLKLYQRNKNSLIQIKLGQRMHEQVCNETENRSGLCRDRDRLINPLSSELLWISSTIDRSACISNNQQYTSTIVKWKPISYHSVVKFW